MSHKPTPRAVEELLSRLEPHRASSNPNEHPCEGAEFHSPRPLRVHGYRLPSGRSFWLCGTCRDNIDTYVTLWEKTGGFDWAIQRCFGNSARNVASIIIADRLNGQHRRGE
jgi:hypothetical protein